MLEYLVKVPDQLGNVIVSFTSIGAYHVYVVSNISPSPFAKATLQADQSGSPPLQFFRVVVAFPWPAWNPSS
jgi:hypothetical protein